ncbi:transposase [Synechococcus sp. MW101C3]|uniref:transposase n=1 Tax=Synechococcus sp. MW101C3 TaxID=210768 RepID=UPI00350FF189
MLGADRHERTGERLGDRPRSLTTQVGDLDLLIPKLRAGSFLPSILEPCRRVNQALYAVIIEAYIGGRLHPQGRCLGGRPGLPGQLAQRHPCSGATRPPLRTVTPSDARIDT